MAEWFITVFPQFVCIYAFVVSGGMVVSVATSHFQDCGFKSHLWSVCLEFSWFPHALWVSTGYSNFLPKSKDMKCRADWHFQMAHSVSLGMSVCLGWFRVLEFRWIGFRSPIQSQ